MTAFFFGLVQGSVSGSADAASPSEFEETAVLTGLTEPTVIRFSSDGRVFVAEKTGVIKVFDGLDDPTPTVFADLNVNVFNFWDRGLLGMALAPGFPDNPWVYVLYAHDAAIGGTAPLWGTPGVYADICPDPPGAKDDGCVVGGRLSRLQASGDTMTGSEQVLIEDWCQQYPGHSVGSIDFGADGALYATSGEGAGFAFTDYGQDGDPVNPCGDPPGGVGGAMTPPTAEGGALRSQDVRTSGDPTGLSGTVIRVDPETGAGLPDNPLAASGDANARRVIAYGFRNPFRMTVRPGTNEVWLGDVGAGEWDEINKVESRPDGSADNYGWPCYEGSGRHAGYDAADLDLCESLYATGDVINAVYAYSHSEQVVPGEACRSGTSSPAGVAFESGDTFPAEYDGALFFADYTRSCIWVMPLGADGQPDPAARQSFIPNAANPVYLTFGPDGALYYADFNGGRIMRVTYTGPAAPPPSPPPPTSPPPPPTSPPPAPATPPPASEAASEPNPSEGEQPAQIASFEGLTGVTKRGDAKANVVRGTKRSDRLYGLGGNDKLLGLAGNDRLDGGKGNDRLLGGNGNDLLRGLAGNDLLVAGKGNDRLLGGLGADVLRAGPGKDVLTGGRGNDRLLAADGQPDTIRCGLGKDRVVADKKDTVARDCELVRRV